MRMHVRLCLWCIVCLCLCYFLPCIQCSAVLASEAWLLARELSVADSRFAVPTGRASLRLADGGQPPLSLPAT